MKANVSAILLGVRDMDRAKEFYTEGLGWKIKDDWGISVFFETDGATPIGFYGREGLAEQVGTSPEGSGFSGLVLTYVVRSEARVDEVLGEAQKAGATILKPARQAAVGRVRRLLRGPGRIHLEPRLQRPESRPALRGITTERLFRYRSPRSAVSP
ncbi:VOC family protein [Actinomadura madurae]|uniref:VOC family protein n=1 Tax=Actinomadura madurae TaxID=1993 RepID=UPI0020D22FF8|nr:VOC family protein [Actinomadura madurae]MCP9955278.1 VOC family protein [Actinomadura madurae]